MKVKLFYFAKIREAIGVDREELDLANDIKTVSDLIEEAMSQRVWLVSPTTLMAVLNTARAVLKDVETRKQVHIIKAELGRLGQEFERFDMRMKKLADNIRQAHEHAQDVHVTSQKISRRFSQIERVELKDDPNALLEFEEEMLAKQEEQNKDES